MTRGTTPIHSFALPFSADLIEAIEITYAQNGSVVLQKTGADCTYDGNTVHCTLTQQETFTFDDRFPVEIQVRVLTGGTVAASGVMLVSVGECLSKEVLDAT